MAGPRTDRTGQIQKRQASDLPALLDKLKPELARALPKHVTIDRMSRIVLTAIRVNPKLAECEPASFFGAVMTLAQLGLEPNTPLGHAYLIPFRNNKRNVTECQVIIGYQGMMDLARRSGVVTTMNANAVRAGDEFSYALGTRRVVNHVPSDRPDRESQKITHVYAVAWIKGSTEPEFEVLPISQVEARRARSRAANNGPWVTDYEAMCLKTAMRALWRWLPKSAEMARSEAFEVASDTGRGMREVMDESVTAALELHGVGVVEDEEESGEDEEESGKGEIPAGNTVQSGPGELIASDVPRVPAPSSEAQLPSGAYAINGIPLFAMETSELKAETAKQHGPEMAQAIKSELARREARP